MQRYPIKPCERCGTPFPVTYAGRRFCCKKCSSACRVPIEIRFWKFVDKNGPIHPVHGQCWVWIGMTSKQGYGLLSAGPKKTPVRASRMSWEIHYGKIPDKMFACHHCDYPLCVRPDHLFLGTPKDNTVDAQKKGRMSRGEHRPASKITEGDVRKIRQLYAEGKAVQTELAAMFGLRQSTVWSILHRKGWKHVE